MNIAVAVFTATSAVFIAVPAVNTPGYIYGCQRIVRTQCLSWVFMMKAFWFR